VWLGRAWRGLAGHGWARLFLLLLELHDMKTIAGQKVLSKTEAAAHAGVTPRCLENWVYLGLKGRTLTRLQVGGRYFFRPADIDEFIKPVAMPATPQERPIPKANNEAAKAELRKLGFEC
jgi:hypothetical protein